MARLERWYRPLTLAGLVALLATPFVWAYGIDLYAYWTIDLAHPYALVGDSLTGVGAFRYAPPMALLMYPLQLLPWEALHVAWLGLQLGSLWYIGRRWALALILFPPVWLDLVYGNIVILLAACVVAGIRHPATWVFPLLTKVTPGVGVLWFAGRRDWRRFGIALGLTLGIVAVSVLVQGTTVWREWIDTLVMSERLAAQPSILVSYPIIPRVVAAALLVLWAGWTNRPWILPLAVTLAMPTLWPYSFVPLIGLVAMHREPFVTKV